MRCKAPTYVFDLIIKSNKSDDRCLRVRRRNELKWEVDPKDH